ncbi:MAG: OmpA family protein [Lautropia sp.]
MKTTPIRPAFRALGCALAAALALCGCAIAPRADGDGPAAGATPARPMARAATGGDPAPSSGAGSGAAGNGAADPGVAIDPTDPSRRGEPRYIRYRADETRLVAAIDDGANTYLEFAGDVESGLAVHDQDGRPLVWTRVGRVAAIAGLHQGVLLRLDERASFVSPNPRWQGRIATTLPPRADYAEARARLENQAMLQGAMARAIAASANRAGVPATAVARPSVPPAAATAPPGGAWPPAAPGSAAQPSGSTLAPLTMANLVASAGEQGLIRVFFASASRAIVAPDDGLATLLREAPRADEIRITGFTDSIGSKESNLRLARSRADAVAQILYRRGVAGARIVVDAVAGDAFLADNASDRGRALNRRAEIVLIRDGRPLIFGSAGR